MKISAVRFLLPLLSLILGNAFPQTKYNYVAKYQLKYCPDSTDRHKIITSKQVLLLSDSLPSVYAVETVISNDTSYYNYLTRENRETNGYFTSKYGVQEKEVLPYHVLQLNGRITTYADFPIASKMPAVKMIENASVFGWQLREDTATIAGFPCQKAECYYGGRHWIGWFTSTVPVSSGPYKFCGLPGLIVKIGDNEGDYNFELKEISNAKIVYPIALYNKPPFDHTLLVNRDTYLKKKRYVADNLYGLLLSANSGKSLTPERKELLRKWAENAKMENNWIELKP